MADVAESVRILISAEAGDAKATLGAISDSLKEIGTAASGSTAGITASAAATDKLGTSQHKAVLELEATQLQVAKLKLQYAELTGDTNAAATAQELLARKFDYAGTEQEKLLLQTGKLSAENDLARARMEKLGTTTESVSTHARTLTTIWTTLASSFVVREFIDANSEIEKLKLGLTNVTGSSTAAAAEFHYIVETANKLGVGIGDVSKAYLGLSAATKGTSLEGEGARVIFEAVAKQLLLLGNSSADVAGALVQVQQGISKGKFELEDLKSIAERMPGFFDKFAASLGLTTAALFDMISKGKITGDDFYKFAQQINASIAGIDVDTFESKMARLDNAFKLFLVSVGSTGVFDEVKKGLDLISGALLSITGVLEDPSLDNVSKLTTNLGLLGGQLTPTSAAAAWLVEKIRSIFGASNEASEGVNLFAEDAKRYQAGIRDFGAAAQESIKTVGEETTKTSELLKTLGIDATEFTTGIDKIVTAFVDLAKQGDVTGEQIALAFKKAISSANTTQEIDAIRQALITAFLDQKIGADQLAASVLKLDEAQAKLDGTTKAGTTTQKEAEEQLKKNEEAARKAEEAAQKYALEMEKIASNERIKLIEAKVELNVARIEADTARIQAAFESINTTIESTGDVIGDAVTVMKDLVPNTDNFRIVEQQLEIENQLRRDAFELQKELTKAQIDNLEAQTRNLERGDAIIKIDGAGLQPELEAFMWKILQTIQVRANRDGLPFLLGV